MAKTSDAIYIPDGSFSWAGGVDSSLVTTVQSALNPQGLPRNALAWLNNATVRGGGITQRTGFQPLLRLIASGKWQGGFLYEPDSANPYLVCQISGVLYSALLEAPFTITDLTKGDPLLLNPVAAEMAFFCQGENFLIIQAGDYYFYQNDADRTLPLFWDGFTLRRSIGITTPTAPAMAPGINEIPAANCMDYYGNRLWYAGARQYAAGDIAGGPSGTSTYHFRDAILSVTENPLCFGGDGFTVPTNAGNIRALKHSASLNAALGQGQFFIFTRKTIYMLDVPTTRTDWINASAANQPTQTVVQIVSGAVGDRSVVSVNGDLFYQSFDPSIRSLQTSVRNFGQWGNTPISQNELRALAPSNRALMRFSSGICFDNRLMMAVLPQVAGDNINVIHRAILPLDFDVVSNLATVGATDVSGTSAMTPPVWEGAIDGLNILQLFEGDFGGLPRAFAVVISDVDGSINVWELTNSNRFDNGDNRVLWSPEFPAFTWGLSGLEFKLKQLKGGELWIDKVAGTVDMEVYYREDADPCWRRWFNTQVCSARCEDYDSPLAVYPCEPFREGYKYPIVFPEPPPRSCDSMGIRPTTIGYQFQVKIMLKGWCRIKGLILYAIPHTDPQYHGIACPSSIPQGMAKLPRLIPSPFVPNVMTQFPPVALPQTPNAEFNPPVPVPPTPGKNPPKQPINPSPLNGAVDVLNPILSWADGGGATSYDVWFNGAFIGNQTGMTYNPGTLADSTPFTWRIDAVNADGTTTGTTWNFTTGVVVAFSYSDPAIVIDWVDSGGANSGNLAEFNAFADPATVTSLIFPTKVGITSIVGLASLPSLTILTCDGTQQPTLDLSGNPALTTVDCSSNTALTSLIPSPALTTLDCHGCTTLPALDVSTCTHLTALDCHGCTVLNPLTITPSLVTLNCAACGIVTLDVHTCIHLTTLDCSLNAVMTTLLIVGCSAIVSIDCHSCNLSDLHCNNLITLITLNCSTNKNITPLILTGCTGLLTLNCLNCLAMTSLNIAPCTALVTLICGELSITSLDVHTALHLVTLNCSQTPGLASINFSGCTLLQTLNCSMSSIAALDVSILPELISLDCSINPLSTLNVTGCTNLTSLTCHDTSLNSLDVHTCSALAYLGCYNCDSLISLDAHGCAALVTILCYFTSNFLHPNGVLATLNVTGCTSLVTLNCYNNSLTALDVSTCTALNQLSCYANSPLTTLNASNCTHLTIFDFSNTGSLTTLTLAGCAGLTSVDCRNRALTALDVSGCTALVTLYAQLNSLNSAAVDTVLCQLNTNGAINGLVNIGGNAAPTGTGVTCANNITGLQSKGWTVIINFTFAPATAVVSWTDSGGPHTGNLAAFNATANIATVSIFACNSLSMTALTNLFMLTALASLSCGGNSITELELYRLTSLVFVNAVTNSLNSTAVDRVFCALNSNGAIGGQAHTAANAAPTADGLACISSLSVKGWMLTY
jgi:hypothetical protein